MNETIAVLAPSAQGAAPPALTLPGWRAFETQGDGLHLVGFCVEQRQHRVTSAVQRFDATKAVAITAGSERYLLEGAPKVDVKVLGTWNQWAREHNAMRSSDVTDSVWSAIRDGSVSPHGEDYDVDKHPASPLPLTR